MTQEECILKIRALLECASAWYDSDPSHAEGYIPTLMEIALSYLKTYEKLGAQWQDC